MEVLISILQINDSKVCFPLDIFAIIQFAATNNIRKVIVSNYIACYCGNNVCQSLLIR